MTELITNLRIEKLWNSHKNEYLRIIFDLHTKNIKSCDKNCGEKCQSLCDKIDLLNFNNIGIFEDHYKELEEIPGDIDSHLKYLNILRCRYINTLIKSEPLINPNLYRYVVSKYTSIKDYIIPKSKEYKEELKEVIRIRKKIILKDKNEFLDQQKFLQQENLKLEEKVKYLEDENHCFIGTIKLLNKENLRLITEIESLSEGKDKLIDQNNTESDDIIELLDQEILKLSDQEILKLSDK